MYIIILGLIILIGIILSILKLVGSRTEYPKNKIRNKVIDPIIVKFKGSNYDVTKF